MSQYEGFIVVHTNLVSGAWLVLPSYIIYVTGSEIIQGLTIASGAHKKSSDDTSLVKVE